MRRRPAIPKASQAVDLVGAEAPVSIDRTVTTTPGQCTRGLITGTRRRPAEGLPGAMLQQPSLFHPITEDIADSLP
jgi:hypothetical protein